MKQAIDTYEIVDGKYVRENVATNANSYLAGLDNLKASYLRSNPFNFREDKTLVKIYSIEDYLIKIDNVELSFGDVIRNPYYSRRKKKKVVRKSFKTWNKDYFRQKNEAFKESAKSIAVIDDLVYPKIKLGITILILICLVFLFFMTASSRFWDKFSLTPFGSYFKIIINGLYLDFPWLKLVVNISIYLVILLIFYSYFFSSYSSNFTKNYEMVESFLKDSKSVISKNYKKKYKKAYKYYKKAVSNPKEPHFAPLDIEEVQEGNVSVGVFKEASRSTVNRAYRFKKLKPILVFIKNILLILSFLGSLVVLGLLLYKMVISIF